MEYRAEILFLTLNDTKAKDIQTEFKKVYKDVSHEIGRVRKWRPHVLPWALIAARIMIFSFGALSIQSSTDSGFSRPYRNPLGIIFQFIQLW
jgi:hypothetical protein